MDNGEQCGDCRGGREVGGGEVVGGGRGDK